MELINRAAQREILTYLGSRYPQSSRLTGLDLPENVVRVNCAYLDDHGLIAVKWYTPHSGPPDPGNATITAKGIDFLADDGGLSAILGVVTVRLHEETLKTLLTDAVEASSEDRSVKERLLDQIKDLPAEATKLAVLEAAKAGLQNAPSLLALLGKSLGL